MWLALALLAWTQVLRLEAVDLKSAETNTYFLSVPGLPEWDNFSTAQPAGRELTVTFDVASPTNSHALFLTQRGVKGAWRVLLNRKEIGKLIPQEQAVVASYDIPAGLLKEHDNQLIFEAPKMVDDIELGHIRLMNGTAAGLLKSSTLNVRVTESPEGTPLPCRITIVDGNGALVALVPAGPEISGFITRPGVIYTRDGMAQVGLLPGDYTVYASRGMEYSAAIRLISLATGEEKEMALGIRREVNTKGWVAADTHIHTLTYSGHGDATVDERTFTIAGEGIELPIATDHNHHTDYSDAALKAKLQEHFTPVIGNEVTTKVGHFNAFPVAAGSTIADFKSDDWTTLIKGMRAVPGVQVITLNHPRDLHSGFIPFAATNLNPVTGKHVRMTNELFDAVEVITSGAMQSDIHLLYRDWFALLNRGNRIVAVSSSDTHDVSRFILGQGRTYVAANDDDPGRIDINEACKNLKDGRASVSFGLFADMDVAQQFHLGDVATNLPDEFIVTVHADSPSWTWVQKVELYANGALVRQTDYLRPNQRLRRSSGFVMKRPFYDVYLVGIATGPGVDAPFAETPRPYQPSSKTFTPRVIASTNPIWIDGDGDGKYTSPRGYAEQLVNDYGTNPERLLPVLAPYDEAIVTQTLALCQERGADIKGEAFTKAAELAAPVVKKVLGLMKEGGR